MARRSIPALWSTTWPGAGATCRSKSFEQSTRRSAAERDFLEYGVVRGNAGNLVVLILRPGGQEEHSHEQEHVGAVLEGEFSIVSGDGKTPSGRRAGSGASSSPTRDPFPNNARSSSRCGPTRGAPTHTDSLWLDHPRLLLGSCAISCQQRSASPSAPRSHPGRRTVQGTARPRPRPGRVASSTRDSRAWTDGSPSLSDSTAAAAERNSRVAETIGPRHRGTARFFEGCIQRAWLAQREHAGLAGPRRLQAHGTACDHRRKPLQRILLGTSKHERCKPAASLSAHLRRQVGRPNGDEHQPEAHDRRVERLRKEPQGPGRSHDPYLDVRKPGRARLLVRHF